MNSRQRITALLHKQIPDRMGLYEHYWPDVWEKWLKEGYPVKEGDGKPEPPQAVFGLDIQPAGPWINRMPSTEPDRVIEESEDWRLVRNSAGATMRYWKHKSGTPEHVSFEMTNRAYWDRVKGHLLELDPARLGNVQAAGQRMRELQAQGLYVVIGNGFVYEDMRRSLGDFGMMQAFLEDPDWIRDIVSVYTDFYIRHYGYFFEHGARPDALFLYDDLGYTNGLWAAPHLISELVMPAHRAIVRFAHEQGIQAILHSCGDIRQGMDLVVEAGYDCIQPMEAKVGNNVLEYAKKYGNRICYMGNINIMALETGDKSAIRREIESKVKPLRNMRIPYIFHSDHSVPPTVSLASYRYALEVFRELSEY